MTEGALPTENWHLPYSSKKIMSMAFDTPEGIQSGDQV